MKQMKVLALVVGLFVLVAALSVAEEQLVDVVHLKDGTVLTGLIVDQVAGVSLKLATAERLVYTLANNEIEQVKKERTKETLPFYYTDVVLLKDGVMFSGMIVEQRPDTSLTLHTENDVLLTFATEEIWKILKEKRIAGVPVDSTEKQARAERAGIKIALQIQTVKDQIRKQESKAPTGSSEEIQGEIESLKEQMQSLEEAEEQIEYDLLTHRRVEERERLKDLQQEIDEILAELLEMIEQCEKGEEGEQTAYSFRTLEKRPLQLLGIGGIASDVASAHLIKQSEEEISEKLSSEAGKIVEQTMYKIPTQEEIDLLNKRQAAYASLTDMLGTSRWKAMSTGGMMRGMAELLPVEDRVFLYETHEYKNALLGMGFNIIPALYLGSWAQGDSWGALIGILQSAACIGGGLGLVIEDSFSQGFQSPWDAGYFPGNVGALFWLGVGVVTLSYSFSFIEPFWYVSRMNKRLRERLLLDEETIRKVKKEEERSAQLNPPALHILPGREKDLVVQLDLVSLSY